MYLGRTTHTQALVLSLAQGVREEARLILLEVAEERDISAYFIVRKHIRYLRDTVRDKAQGLDGKARGRRSDNKRIGRGDTYNRPYMRGTSGRSPRDTSRCLTSGT